MATMSDPRCLALGSGNHASNSDALPVLPKFRSVW